MTGHVRTPPSSIIQQAAPIMKMSCPRTKTRFGAPKCHVALLYASPAIPKKATSMQGISTHNETSRTPTVRRRAGTLPSIHTTEKRIVVMTTRLRAARLRSKRMHLTSELDAWGWARPAAGLALGSNDCLPLCAESTKSETPHSRNGLGGQERVVRHEDGLDVKESANVDAETIDLPEDPQQCPVR
jgi:hypothetical protein